MSRLLVLVLFLAASASSAVAAIGVGGNALADGTLVAWATAAHAGLKLGIVGAFTYFIAVRDAPKEPSRRPLAFLSCAAALGAVMVVEEPARGASAGSIVVGDLVAVAFGAWLLASVIALGRCFGILPEARGLVVRGPYRLVRHPVYLGEIGVCAGLALAAPSTRNFVAACVFAAAQAVRMRLEEEALTKAFPSYAAYATATPRLIPRPGRRGVPVVHMPT